MKEQIKQAATAHSQKLDTDYQEHAFDDFVEGANHVLNNYYYPLISAIEKLKDSKQHDKHWARVETIILNAKKLTNETE